jgi:hypothetical protein
MITEMTSQLTYRGLTSLAKLFEPSEMRFWNCLLLQGEDPQPIWNRSMGASSLRLLKPAPLRCGLGNQCSQKRYMHARLGASFKNEVKFTGNRFASRKQSYMRVLVLQPKRKCRLRVCCKICGQRFHKLLLHFRDFGLIVYLLMRKQK